MTDTCISGYRTQQRQPRLIGAWVAAAMHALPGIHRITVYLADVEGYSYREPVSRSAASSHASTAVAAVSAL